MKYRFQWNAPIRISPHNPDVVYTTSQFVHRTRTAASTGKCWTQPGSDAQRQATAELLGRRGHHARQHGRRGLRHDLRVRGVAAHAGAAVGGQRRRPRAPVARQRQDVGEHHAARTAGGLRQHDRPLGAQPGPRAHRGVSLPPGRLHAVPLPDERLRRDVEAHRRRHERHSGRPLHARRRARIPPVAGLLYAGTEFGLYASFDDGAHWQPFQLNLPRTPVTDMMIYRDDLIVTTQGRGFWISTTCGAAVGCGPACSSPRRGSSSRRTRTAKAASRRRSTTGSVTRRRRR